jgi:hypothetical protein
LRNDSAITGDRISHKAKIILTLVLISIGLIVAGSSSHVEAKSSGKLKVTFTDYGNYRGKVKVTLKNLDISKTLVKSTFSFAHVHDSPPTATFKFSTKGSEYGDQVELRVTGNGGSWTFPELDYRNTMHFAASLEEIDCGDNDC